MGSEALQRLRRITQCLFISGGVNILLLTAVFYLLFRESPPTPYCEAKPASLGEQQTPLALDRSNAEVIRKFRTMPLDRLIPRLSNSQLVENGFTQRELALAALVAFHHFDIKRALGPLPAPLQTRTVIFGKRPNGASAELTVYPCLSEAQFEAIVKFAQTELWPLTSKGLFLLRQKQGSGDASLSDAIFQTPEFIAVMRLFNSAQKPVDKQELLNMLLEGNWQMLSSFYDHQRASQDLSVARRQKFLLDYIDKRSATAADILLRYEGAFAVQKLDDQHVVMVLQLLDPGAPAGSAYAKALLKSPRKDTVLEAASAFLKKTKKSEFRI